MPTLYRFDPLMRGSSYSATVNFTLASGSLTDSIIRVMVKRELTDSDEDAALSIDNDVIGGVTITDATSPCEIELEFTDTDTAAIPNTGRHYIGIQLELSDGSTVELSESNGLNRNILVVADVVRAVAEP